MDTDTLINLLGSKSHTDVSVGVFLFRQNYHHINIEEFTSKLEKLTVKSQKQVDEKGRIIRFYTPSLDYKWVDIDINMWKKVNESKINYYSYYYIRRVENKSYRLYIK